MKQKLTPEQEYQYTKTLIREMVHNEFGPKMEGSKVDAMFFRFLKVIPTMIEKMIFNQGGRFIPPFRVSWCDEDHTVYLYFLDELQ